LAGHCGDVAGAAAAFAGLIVPALRAVYNYAWFAGFGVSFLVYLVLESRQRRKLTE